MVVAAAIRRVSMQADAELVADCQQRTCCQQLCILGAVCRAVRYAFASHPRHLQHCLEHCLLCCTLAVQGGCSTTARTAGPGPQYPHTITSVCWRAGPLLHKAEWGPCGSIMQQETAAATRGAVSVVCLPDLWCKQSRAWHTEHWTSNGGTLLRHVCLTVFRHGLHKGPDCVHGLHIRSHPSLG